TQLRLAIHFRQVVLENRPRDVNRREHVGDQADGQRNRETANRSGAEQEQEEGRNYGRDVRVDDRHERLLETGVHSRSWRLAVAQLFANALKNQYVRVNAHADGQDDASDAWKRQHSTKVGERGKKNNQVEQER